MTRAQKAQQLRLLRLLTGGLLVIGVLHVLVAVLHDTFESPVITWAHRFLDLDSEYNIPTFYAALLWLTSAGLCVKRGLQAGSGSLTRTWWLILALIMAYVGIDEVFILHERFAEPLRDFLSIGGDSIFFHAWVLLAGGVGVGLGLMYWLLRRHDQASRLQRHVLLLIIATIAGVVALELAGTQLYFSPLVYDLIPVLIEEVFELTMASLILYRLAAPVKAAARARIPRPR